MARYIDAELLKLDFPQDEDWEYPVNTNEYVCERIDKQPTANVVEIKHGHWIIHLPDPCGHRACETIECSVCHAEQRYLLDDNYCPNCGAIMRRGERPW